uniref:adenylate kinase n=1 Tax=Oryza nivara TaxID=4536 RepID=A0A0E0HMD2_ORYNI
MRGGLVASARLLPRPLVRWFLQRRAQQDINENMLGGKKVKIIFVLGGPGSGKGTQCSNIVEHFDFIHLSAGELLRAEINSGSENGTMIDTIITEGKIVPSEITIKLLQEAIIKGGNDKYIIDGFPRNEENRVVFESVTLVTYFQLLEISISPEFVLFFDCSEEEMERRLLGRNQGRSDDNIETIRKRLKVFVESSLPVIEYYESKGMVKKIDATKPAPEVFEDIIFLLK